MKNDNDLLQRFEEYLKTEYNSDLNYFFDTVIFSYYEEIKNKYGDIENLKNNFSKFLEEKKLNDFESIKKYIDDSYCDFFLKRKKKNVFIIL